MALDARTRSSIYNKLLDLLGDEDANALMSEFPAVEADELVTKQFLRAELAEVRAEVAGLSTELHAEIAGLSAQFQSELGEVRTGLGTEIRAGLAGLRVESQGEMHSMRTEMAERFHQQTLWLGGGLAGATALVLAAIPVLS